MAFTFNQRSLRRPGRLVEQSALKLLIAVACALLGSTAAPAQEFPGSFVGCWEGALLWYQAGKEPRKVPMQLVVQPSDSAGQFTWRMVYGEQGADNRPYLLKPVDTARGHWVIDERNGIVLDQYWIGGRLTGAFTVQGTTIISSYGLQGAELVVEFQSMGSAPIHTTGGGAADIPPVDSYAVKGYQRAVLKKKK